MDQADQIEIRGHYKTLSKLKSDKEKAEYSKQLAQRCHSRAKEMMHIISQIGQPTFENIGIDGAKAVSVLTLHSFKNIMKQMLGIYNAMLLNENTDFYMRAIPPLTDKLMILEEKLQYYGTNWNTTNNGEFYLIPIKDFSNVNQRRAQFGMEPVKKPVVLSIGQNKHPLGTGDATETDQKPMTDEEYLEFTQFYKEAMI